MFFQKIYSDILLIGQPLYLIFILLGILNFICFPLPTAKRIKTAYDFNIGTKNDKLTIFSAYENRKSGNISLILIGKSKSKWERKSIKLIGNSNEIVTFRPKRKTSHNLCDNIVLIAEIEMKDQEKYELSFENNLIPIKTKLASQENHEIVICTPPIYSKNIDFQTILITTNFHISIGAFIQFYINQKTIYEEFRKFPKIGVDYFEDYSKFEMGGLEIANQDCLNRFKASSKFITFLDHDNLFIPNKGKKSLVQFTEIFSSYRFNTLTGELAITESHHRLVKNRVEKKLIGLNDQFTSGEALLYKLEKDKRYEGRKISVKIKNPMMKFENAVHAGP